MKKKIGNRWNWPTIAFDVTAFALCYGLVVESMTVIGSGYAGNDILAMFVRIGAALAFYGMTMFLIDLTGKWHQ